MNALAVVSVSGGKDSTACALLAIDRLGVENCRFVFADTGHEHAFTVDYVRDYLPSALGASIDTVRADFARQIAGKREHVEHVWPTKGVPDEIIRRALAVLHPTGVPFLDLCLWKGRFPSRRAQFCTQHLKRIPLDAYLLDRMGEGVEVESWRGIRRDESEARKDTAPRELTPEGFAIVHPIHDWTAKQVVDYVVTKGVRLNPLYSQGMRRVGCMPCINCAKDELWEIANRWPQYIDVVREWESLVSMAAKRGMTTFFTDSAGRSPVPRPGWRREQEPADDGRMVDVWIEPNEAVFARCAVDERVRWAETARGGRQIDFIRSTPPNGCASVYGLCE